MNTTVKAYPQPVESSDNTTYLQGWKQGKLMLQYCGQCHHTIFYPRAMCPHCWNESLDWVQASGRGTVTSYSLIRRPNHPAFNDEVPIALAEIELVEGVAMLARVLDVTPEIGMSVVLASEPEAIARYPLPAFRAAP